MPATVNRKPIGNFFIKRSLQLRLIMKIVLAVVISTIVSSFSLIFVYFIKYNTVIVYQLEKMTQELTREHIIFLILPTLVISSIVNLIVAFGIGMYASRKYAVPIYKLEQWAALLRDGKLTALLRFREKEEMKELSDRCNQLAANLCEHFTAIKKHTDKIKESGAIESEVKAIEDVLSGMEIGASPIEVSTSILEVDNGRQSA